MAIWIAGTGTDVGKTIFSTLVMIKYAREYSLFYWKPVQAGEEEKDLETIRNLSSLPDLYFIKELYTLQKPASPHLSAELEGKFISKETILSACEIHKKSNVLVEMAGGLMVPLNRSCLFLDIIEEIKEPLILLADPGLGTINHSLLSIETLRKRNIPVIGFFFSGKYSPLMEDNAEVIETFSSVPFLGSACLPEDFSPQSLYTFAENEFDKDKKLIEVLKNYLSNGQGFSQ
ncbi:MAG: dethiobiotin synthase [Leptospiraceae bacterium]|nr:dethiobiotin synthase [Leptospiraceae bacterium]MCP5501856.1 dethiobiotin synthase [Leptospiraceae bacterium]